MTVGVTPNNCGCIDQIDAALERQGNASRVAAVLSLTGAPPKAQVQTHIPFAPAKKRGEKPVVLIATYCPFCGVKYPAAS